MSGETYKGKSGKEEPICANGTDFKIASTQLLTDKSLDYGNTAIIIDKAPSAEDLSETHKGSKAGGSSRLTRISEDSIVFTDDSCNSPIPLSKSMNSLGIPSHKGGSPEDLRSLCSRLRNENSVLMDNLKHSRSRCEFYEKRFEQQWQRTAELEKMVIET